MKRRRRLLAGGVAAGALLAMLLAEAPPATGLPPDDPALEHLSPTHRRWLEDVELLISETERETFLSLDQAYQRDHFIRRFWRVRDPFPRTPRNELRERWEARAAQARDRFGGLASDRARATLLFGEPSRRKPISCLEILQPLEVWVYAQGSDRIRGAFTLIFFGREPGQRGGRNLWDPNHGLQPLLQLAAGLPHEDPALAQVIVQRCIRGAELLGDLAQALDHSGLDNRGVLTPDPGEEWVLSFRARSTELPSDAKPLPAELRLAFPGRRQSRTVVQGLLAVPRAAATAHELGKTLSYNFIVDGEVLRQGELFDQFRYRFDFAAEEVAGEELGLVLERYLRPGNYRLIVKLEEVGSGRAFRAEQLVEVPSVPRRRSLLATTQEPSTPASPPEAASVGFETRLAEANASISTGDHTVTILKLPQVLNVGKLRVVARTKGEGIAAVAFHLNGRPVMKKRRPPYSVEVDLGDKPRTHTLQAVALDQDDTPLARDEVMVNAGPHRFSMRIVEPQHGNRYRHSVRAHVEVDVPEGERLDRVELFLNERRVATLYQPPYEQPVLLPGSGDLTYLRAVAYLTDGNSTEDVVFINAPDFVDEVDVHYVQLFTSVVDRKGQFVEDLAVEDFRVFEDGIEQQIRRFELVRDLPIHAGLVLDTSISMLEELRDVERAAYRFLEDVLKPKDRAAVITFSDEPRLAVRFTNDKEVLAGGLSALVADGETALFDSLVFALHYFSGLAGKRAIAVLTDGEDSRSHYSFDDALEFARRTGVAIYIVGLNLNSSEREAQIKMRRLAEETGGECFFVDRVGHLERVYGEIQEELRSQYLLAYQSSQGKTGGDFRRLEVKLTRRGLEAKAIKGYFP